VQTLFVGAFIIDAQPPKPGFAVAPKPELALPAAPW
jgi:hypothetical protein